VGDVEQGKHGRSKPARPAARLLSFQSASAEYGVPATSLRDLVLRGALPAVRFPESRRVWLRREDLERLIEQSTTRGER
jgi:hypothetical protein